MAKFCTKCGKPLQDGKPCSCTVKKEKEIAVKMQVDEDEEEIDESKVGSMLDDFMVVIKGMFKKPVNTIEKNLNVKNYNLALVSIVINLVLFGLLGHVFIDNCLKNVGFSLNNVEGLISGIDENITSMNNLNIGLKCGIGMGVVSLCMIGILYLMHNEVYKKKINVKKIMVLVGITEVFLSVGYLLSMVVSFISLFLALVVFIAFTIIFFVYLYQGYLLLAKTKKSQSIYSYIAGMVIPVVAFSIVTGIASVSYMVSAAGKSTVNNSAKINSSSRGYY